MHTPEGLLCRIVADLVGRARVDVDDRFFDLGGDSITAMQLVSRAREAGLVITRRDVFRCQSVAELASVAREVAPSAGADARQGDGGAGQAGDGVGSASPTPAMRAFDIDGMGVDSLQQAVVVRVPAGASLPQLTTVIEALLDQHDVLRARVSGPVGDRHLEIPEPGSVDAAACIERVALASDVDADGLASVVSEGMRRAQDLLDPAAGVMFRAVWFDAGPGAPGRLLLVAHQLVIDGASWHILLPDLPAAWEAVTQGRPVDLAPTGTSFRAWSQLLDEEAQNPARVKDLPYWARVLKGSEPLLHSRELCATRDTLGTAGTATWTLPASETVPLLTSLPSMYSCGVDDILLTGLALAFARWRRAQGREEHQSLLVDLEVHGRQEITAGVDVSRTVGWFTRVHPVRLDAGTDTSVGTALKKVKEQLRSVPDSGIGYGMLRHLNRHTAQRLEKLPQPQIAFHYLGRSSAPQDADWAMTVENAAIEGAGDERMPLRHALRLTAAAQDHVDGPQLTFTCTWAGELLDEQDVRNLGDAWVTALTALAEHAQDPHAGGRTPSDLSLVSLDQSEIDDIAQQLSL
ncbi:MULTISPECIES: condensation domain-containing protein [unclassified Streptomyces]|uniref:condensation domain-containing protein n=1 Tax=unclassified Streptomyces TaxID=2593676 RepID=UPI002DDC651C|nr:condensation domain-containing protein [Streptomyces sp. NBC_01237]WRZ76349.1 condensation domain-containing protein [Streptomyces sp. NBC_01237]